MELMFQPLKKYVQLDGRARRSEYWLFFLFQMIVAIVLAFAGGLIPAIEGITDLVGNIFSLAMLLPSIAVGVRRFHDINRTGWWLFFPLAVLVIALIAFLIFKGSTMESSFANIDTAAVEAGDTQAVLAALSAMAPLLLWVALPWFLASLVTFVFHVTDGTRGKNRFGADPKGGSADTSVF